MVTVFLIPTGGTLNARNSFDHVDYITKSNFKYFDCFVKCTNVVFSFYSVGGAAHSNKCFGFIGSSVLTCVRQLKLILFLISLRPFNTSQELLKEVFLRAHKQLKTNF